MRTLTQPLNMSPGGIPPVIHVSQYDSDFTIVFTLFSTVGDFTIESGTTAMVRGTKSSGTGYSADATINISAKTVTVTGNQQMTAAAGQNVFEITLLKDGKEISSKNFILLCERAALDADTITDESVLKELNAIIESADTATQAAEEAEAAADRAEAAAQTLVIDSTLTHSGQAADAKATGDALAEIRDDLEHIGLSDSVKVALLDVIANIALWKDGDGQQYYDALETALYEGDYPRITATFNSGSNIIYTDDALDALKQYLVVKYKETKESSEVIIASNAYTLSGTLSDGENVIRVLYESLSTTFIAEAVDFYNIHEWQFPTDGHLRTVTGVWETVNSNLGISGTTIRRSLYSTKGKWPCAHATKTGSYYPLPIPIGSTQAQITLTPSSMIFASTVWRYDEGTGKYVTVQGTGTGWVTGSGIVNIPTGDNLALIVSYRYNDNRDMSSGDNISSISVVFS